jgi:hypothetical protein
MNKQLFIPTKCKVGFNTKTDTYTGKLGYIIYHDGKVWRKEVSWESWREKYIIEEEFETKKLQRFNDEVSRLTNEYNKYKGAIKPTTYPYIWEKVNTYNTLEEYLKYQQCNDYDVYKFGIPKMSLDITINPIEFNNIPIEGFVLNKKVGGNKYSSWNPRQTYCRVYDPRGWEFEITIPNLLFILECTNSIKGKGLEGNFVYSWNGKDLVLLPCNSENYQSSLKHTELQSKKVTIKELKVGSTYLNSKGNELLYLGKLDIVKEVKDGIEEYEYTGFFNRNAKGTRTKYKDIIVKQFVFYTSKSKYTWANSENYKYEQLTSITSIKQLVSDVIPENFAELLENYYKLFKTKLDE